MDLNQHGIDHLKVALRIVAGRITSFEGIPEESQYKYKDPEQRRDILTVAINELAHAIANIEK